MTNGRAPEHIGLLLIHGIGDQPRGEHLKNVTEALASALRAEHGEERVTVTVNSPFSSRGHVTVVVVPENDNPQTQRGPEDRLGIVVDVREVWWRDLAENPTVSAVAKFWWWAMTFCAARKRIPRDTPRLLAPTSPTVLTRSVSLGLRIEMFAKTTAFFIILLPVHLAFQLIAIFPLIQRIHFLRTVFAYLNSVRVYQEEKTSEAHIVDNLFECRRLSILKRAVNEAASFATRKDFDRWYVMGHSLGSVIAHNLVNLSPQAISRLLPDWTDAVRSDAEFYRGDQTDWVQDASDENMPAHPCWFPDKYGIDSDKFFERLRGLITYGSPLETFARFWPDIVMTRRDAIMPADFKWINLYDPIDLVAAPIVSLPQIGGALVQNIPISTHPLFFLAHTSYLSRKSRRVGQKIAMAVGRWLIGGPDRDLADNLKGAGVHSPSWARATALRVALIAQAMLILGIGSLFLPRIVANLGYFFIRLGTETYKFASETFTKSLESLDRNCGEGPVCGLLHRLSEIGPKDNIFLDAAFSLAVMLAIFVLLVGTALLGRLFHRQR